MKFQENCLTVFFLETKPYVVRAWKEEKDFFFHAKQFFQKQFDFQHFFFSND